MLSGLQPSVRSACFLHVSSRLRVSGAVVQLDGAAESVLEAGLGREAEVLLVPGGKRLDILAFPA
jgi:hypothetical protein